MDINKLRQARGKLIDELKGLTKDAAAFAAKEKEIADLDAEIERAGRADKLAASLAQPVDGRALENQERARAQAQDVRKFLMSLGREPALKDVREVIGFKPDPEKHFASFGEQLVAMARYEMSKGADFDRRLVRAPTGAGEVDPTGGGFLVQVDFAQMVWTRAYTVGEVLQRVLKFPISSGANGIKIPGVDETSRATGSRFGGVQSYWLAEGDSITTSKPKFRWIEFDLKKLGSLMYVTDELLADTTLFGGIATTAFSEELVFMTEDAIIEGDGAGKPLGILNANCTVQIAKETGQAAKTIVKENIDKMWGQLWNRSRSNAVWLVNQLIRPQLQALNIAVGTGGAPVFLPAGGLSGEPYDTLYGRPIVEIEQASALGTPGDIILADLSQYGVADKGGVEAASSMHLKFDSDQMAFRYIYRVDGKPMWSTPLTPFKGSGNLSPFITLAAR